MRCTASHCGSNGPSLSDEQRSIEEGSTDMEEMYRHQHRTTPLHPTWFGESLIHRDDEAFISRDGDHELYRRLPEPHA
jgi:hypothetical protein